MEPAPLPPEEPVRLEALHRLGVLDTAAEPSLDLLVAHAAQELEMPIALVSLVDAQRQWFKARVGLDATETPRDISFCGHAIVGHDIFIVEDATRDERFADNPLVTAAPSVRFYAGAPLEAPDGHRIGTLCVIDTRPRKLTEHQICLLRALADIAAWELARKHWLRTPSDE